MNIKRRYKLFLLSHINQLFVLIACLLGLFVCTGQTKAQKPKSQLIFPSDFNVQPKYEVYDMEQDTNGYIYMVGEGKVIKFNGYSFKELDGLEHGEYGKGIFKTSTNQIIVLGNQGTLAKVDNDTISPIHLLPSMKQKIMNGIESLDIDNNNVLHMGIRRLGYYQCDSTGREKMIIGKESKKTGFIVTKLPNGRFIHWLFGNSRRDSLFLHYLDQNGTFNLIWKGLYQTPKYETDVVQLHNGSSLISFGNNVLIKFKEDQLIEEMEFHSPIIKLFVDSKKNLWIGTVNNGVYKVSSLNFDLAEQYLSESVGVVAEDNNGGIWIKSKTKSFAYIEPPANPVYSNRNNLLNVEEITHTCMHKSALFLKSRSDTIIQIKDDLIRKIAIPDSLYFNKEKEQVNDFFCMKFDTTKKRLWLTSRGFAIYLDSIGWHRVYTSSISDREYSIRDIHFLEDGHTLFLHYSKLLYLNQNKIERLPNKTHFSAQKFIPFSKDSVLISQKRFVGILNRDTCRSLSEYYPYNFNKRAIYAKYSNRRLWVQLVETPLVCIENNRCIEVKDIYGQPIITTVAGVNKDGDFWAMVKGSPQLVNYNSDLPLDSGVYYCIDPLLAQNKVVKSIEVDTNRLYINGLYGSYKVSKNNLIKGFCIDISTHIYDLRINSKSCKIRDSYDLRYSDNTIQIGFECINYSRAPVTYKYRLTGFDSTWVESRNTSTQYTNLGPGAYTFEIKSRVDESKWGPIKQISFNISKPFWAEIWFILICISLMSGLVYLIVRYRYNQIIFRENTKLESSRLEMRALIAQLNPHFIFNSIASIKYYLAENKTEDAERYLQRFSDLIRSVLEVSESQEVSLNDEVNLMESYVQLESERLDGASIDFNVRFKGFNPQLVFIPPLLFQPYIENAIWHGLVDKKDNREVLMEFSKINNLLKAEISDNGIGREAAKQKNRYRHKRSFGMQIANRRIELLQSNYKKRVQYVDIADSQGNVQGTQVIIYIQTKTI